MIVEYDNARVLVTDMKIENIKEIIPILEQVSRINQSLIIIAEDVSGESPDFKSCQNGQTTMAAEVLWTRIPPQM